MRNRHSIASPPDDRVESWVLARQRSLLFDVQGTAPDARPTRRHPLMPVASAVLVGGIVSTAPDHATITSFSWLVDSTGARVLAEIGDAPRSFHRHWLPPRPILMGSTGNVAAVVEVFVHEVATRDYLRRELEEIRDLLADLHRPAGTGPDETGTQAAHRHSKKKGELAVAIAVTTSLPSRYGGVVHR